jgi:hypothetical protein
MNSSPVFVMLAGILDNLKYLCHNINLQIFIFFLKPTHRGLTFVERTMERPDDASTEALNF